MRVVSSPGSGYANILTEKSPGVDHAQEPIRKKFLGVDRAQELIRKKFPGVDRAQEPITDSLTIDFVLLFLTVR